MSNTVEVLTEATEGPWQVVALTTTRKLVIAPNEPKVRRNVAAVGGPRRVERARLIAAAPDFLAAFRDFPARADYARAEAFAAAVDEWWVHDATPAIAKATGSR